MLKWNLWDGIRSHNTIAKQIWGRKLHFLCPIRVHLKQIFNITKYLKLINDRKQFYDLNFFQCRFIKFTWHYLWSKIVGKIALRQFMCADFPLIFIFCMKISSYYEVYWLLYATQLYINQRLVRNGARTVWATMEFTVFKQNAKSIWMAHYTPHMMKKMRVYHCDAHIKSSWAKVSV